MESVQQFPKAMSMMILNVILVFVEIVFKILQKRKAQKLNFKVISMTNVKKVINSRFQLILILIINALNAKKQNNVLNNAKIVKKNTV